MCRAVGQAGLKRDGWKPVRTVGSHRQCRHAVKPRTVPVSGKPGIDMTAGTPNSVLKQAGLKK